MKIKRLKISNFRNVIEFEIDNCPNTVVLAGPNGSGKSSVLEAIGILKEIAAPYHSARTMPGMVTTEADFCEIEADIEIYDTEKVFLQSQGRVIDSPSYKCLVRFNKQGNVVQNSRDENLRILLQHYEPGSGVGIVEYLNPYRRMPRRRLQAISSPALEAKYSPSGASTTTFSASASYALAISSATTADALSYSLIPNLSIVLREIIIVYGHCLLRCTPKER